ncbi:MAG: pitrilysin family protein [Chloroflexota bacterium]
MNNGLRITLSHDNRSPIVAVNLRYSVGSGHEKSGKTGFAHLFEHMMFQGSTNVSKGEHSSLIEASGGKANATTSWDRTNYFERLPSHELELALWLESDRLASLLPAMTQKKLDNQREVVKNERRRNVDNQPYGSWDEKLQTLLFPEGHPYQHPILGSMEDLDRASLADVSDFFAAHYAPNNAVLTIAGDFDPPTALGLIEKYFGPLPANPAVAPAPSTLIQTRVGAKMREIVLDRVPLPRLYIACRTPAFGSADFEALEVAMDLLGTGRASRLYRALVREQQLAQDVSTFAFPEIGGAAVFALSVTARPEVGHEVLETAMWTEVDRLTAQGPTDDELERVRNLHAAGVESSLQRVGERADRLSMYACLFDEPERINKEVSRYVSVDAARVREALAVSLRPDNRVVLIYLPVEHPDGA